jgi:hypothetical protein
LKLPIGLSAGYKLHAFRDSKKYPFVFTDSLFIRKVNQNENDRVQIDQQLKLRFDRDSLLFIETWGSYGILYHYYYRELRSAESRKTKEYRIGLNSGFKPGVFELREQLVADAEVSDYYFKKVEGATVTPPPYSRDVTSTLSGKWNLKDDRIHLVGKWVEMYHDDGFWYGKEYWPDSGGISRECYAIERKGTQYWVDGAFDCMIGSCKLTLGSTLRDVFQRRFDRPTATYVISELDIGYGIEPYMHLDWSTEQFLLNLRLKRIFNTRDDERWNREKNWDLSLSLQVVF